VSEWIFSEEAVVEAARARAGLSDFGDDDFREGLRVLLAMYDSPQAGLSEKGRKQNWRRIVDLLAMRLRMEDAWRRHPEIRDVEIRKPMFLTGFPRTGTSALFNLLGLDPAARPLLLWESYFPDPLEDLAPGADDPRRIEMKERNARMREQNPEFTAIHFTDADNPEECVLLMSSTMQHVHNGIEVLVEPYLSWFQKIDLTPPYRYYKEILKLLSWQRPGERWMLKSPAHLWAVDVLVDQFPDCCIVFTHRNLGEVMASYCSMMAMLFNLNGFGEQVGLGETVLEYLARSMERALEARDRVGSGRFIDIRFDDFVADNMATLDTIYSHFELPIDDDARETMASHVRNNPKGKHGKHEYDLEQYGLSADRIRDRLSFYVDRFALEVG
jgi:hypothetical protein